MTRVQIAPHLDRWMKGDRYGTVVRITRRGPGKDNLITVKMDKSGQTVRYAASLVSKVL